MEYLAHIAEDGRKQTVQAHLEGTAALCEEFASSFGAGEQGRLAGLAHDIGKYSSAFQARLLGGDKVDHATAGALECFKRNQPYAAVAVTGHHGGLPDLGYPGDGPDSATFWARMNRGMQDKLEPYGAWAGELPPANLPAFCRKDPLTDAFFIRMLYSCLVDADYLDTEAFMQGRPREPLGTTDMGLLLDKLLSHISEWFPPQGALNQQRCAILESCLSAGGKHTPGLFTLTVPTGGGKTVASLAFALAHAKARGLRRVVYVIPYTSIIEQTADTFRTILGSENVLEHHSGVAYDTDAAGELSKENQAFLCAAENWDMPVVVTTAVQFFESLYANRSSRCRKLHNLAGSVIIFDEAQMLPIPYLRPCVCAISQLLEHYGASAVLCTATQPALDTLFEEFLPGRKAVELCPPEQAADPIFRRVTFRKAGKLTWNQLAEALNGQEQALCIVNSRKAADTLYQKLTGEGTFHLSTLMVPAHRRAVLAEIRRRLNVKEPCRVVSTSLIEAGVDADFPMVFREEAGLDSILQAAGRCNREGRRPPEESFVTIFQPEDPPPALFATDIGAGRLAMDAHEDPASPEAIAHYFKELLNLKGAAAQDRENILPLLRDQGIPFRQVAEKFHLIENNTHTVYIPWGEGETLVWRLQEGEHSRQLFRQLGLYGVSVFDRHFQSLAAAGALTLLKDGSAILRDIRLYSEETGLTSAPETGFGDFI